MMKLSDLLREGETALQKAGVDTPQMDTRLLAGHVLDMDRADLMLKREHEIPEPKAQEVRALIARRAAREPVARILGLREFWGLPFALNEATLEPRPDSETLIELVLEKMRSRQNEPLRLLDLGTGTGCLLLSLLHELPSATGLGADRAPRALEQAKANAARLGLEARAGFWLGDWLAGMDERFDLIVANPPYIPSADLPHLQPEVRLFDPAAALDGGADGLGPYRKIIPLLPRYLKSGGLAVFEVGFDQAEAVSALLRQAGLEGIEVRHDLGGIERVVSGYLARAEATEPS